MLGFLTTALAAAVGFLFSSFIRTWFDYYVSGAAILSKQQDFDLEAVFDASIDVRDRAVSYWSRDDTDRDTFLDGAAISGRLMFIGKVVDGLFEGEAELLQSVNDELNRFDECVTRGSFGVTNREAEPNRLVAIEDAFYSFVYVVRRSRRKLKRHVIKR